MLRSVYGIYILGLIAGAWLMNSIRDLENSDNGMLTLALVGGFIISSLFMLKGRK